MCSGQLQRVCHTHSTLTKEMRSRGKEVLDTTAIALVESRWGIDRNASKFFVDDGTEASVRRISLHSLLLLASISASSSAPLSVRKEKSIFIFIEIQY